MKVRPITQEWLQQEQKTLQALSAQFGWVAPRATWREPNGDQTLVCVLYAKDFEALVVPMRSGNYAQWISLKDLHYIPT